MTVVERDFEIAEGREYGELRFDTADSGKALIEEIRARYRGHRQNLETLGRSIPGSVSVLALLSEDEEIEVLRRLRDRTGSAMKIILDTAFEEFVRVTENRSKGGSRNKRSPDIVRAAVLVFKQTPLATAKEAWEAIISNVYLLEEYGLDFNSDTRKLKGLTGRKMGFEGFEGLWSEIRRNSPSSESK